MSLSLLRNGPPEPLSVLHLRLLHGWKLGHPARISHFFAYGTLWVDSEGVRVQGDSHRNFAEALQKRVVVGAVYKVTCYGICPLRPAFRACRFPHCIQITPSTKFELQPPTDPPFIRDSFDFIDFALLPKRLPPCPYLTDLIGKVVGVGRPNHVDGFSGVAPVQSVTLADTAYDYGVSLCIIGHLHTSDCALLLILFSLFCSGLEVVVSLWSEFSNLIDPDTVRLDDALNPVIIGFSCLRITPPFGEKPTASSCLASHIIMQPSHPAVEHLHREYATFSLHVVLCIVFIWVVTVVSLLS
ncbi:hypothetical protein LINPERHAP1_LOCUS20448 [Linum perenne]